MRVLTLLYTHRRMLQGILDDGVVVGPGLLEPMRQQFDGLCAVAGEDEKSSRCCAESACYPKDIFHCE